MTPLLTFRFDVYIHNDVESSAVISKLDVLTVLLKTLGDKLMARSDDLQNDVEALRVALDNATNEIAADLERLRQENVAQIRDGLTPDQATQLQNAFNEKIGTLTQKLVELGKDPVNPVPVPEP